jgi:hypothetical protein
VFTIMSFMEGGLTSLRINRMKGAQRSANFGSVVNVCHKLCKGIATPFTGLLGFITISNHLWKIKFSGG